MLRAIYQKNNKSFERIGISVLNFIQCATPTNAGLNKRPEQKEIFIIPWRVVPEVSILFQLSSKFMVSESYLF